jgi:hypothetical protein
MRAVCVAAVLLGLCALTPAEGVAKELRPILARSVLVSPVTGKVRVKAAGTHRFVQLRGPRGVPTGSFIDTRRGTVRLVTAAAAGGKTQSGRFDGGAFVVKQHRSALTDLVLAGTRRIVDICGNSAGTAASKPLPPKVIRKLHGNAKGSFRTVGRYAAATVRGTVWDTVDRCDGTLATAETGAVNTAFGTQTLTLGPGESLVAYCFPPGSAFHGPQFCLVLILYPNSGIFGWGIGTRVAGDAPAYDVCLRRPSGNEQCTTHPLGAPDEGGLRVGEVVCQQGAIGRPGLYSVRWIIGGAQVGIPLSFAVTSPMPPPGGACEQRP